LPITLLSQRAPCASRKALNFFYRTVHGSAVGQPSLADHFDVHHHSGHFGCSPCRTPRSGPLSEKSLSFYLEELMSYEMPSKVVRTPLCSVCDTILHDCDRCVMCLGYAWTMKKITQAMKQADND